VAVSELLADCEDLPLTYMMMASTAWNVVFRYTFLNSPAATPVELERAQRERLPHEWLENQVRTAAKPINL
jgi:hypothetical protein